MAVLDSVLEPALLYLALVQQFTVFAVYELVLRRHTM